MSSHSPNKSQSTRFRTSKWLCRKPWRTSHSCRPIWTSCWNTTRILRPNSNASRKGSNKRSISCNYHWVKNKDKLLHCGKNIQTMRPFSPKLSLLWISATSLSNRNSSSSNATSGSFMSKRPPSPLYKTTSSTLNTTKSLCSLTKHVTYKSKSWKKKSNSPSIRTKGSLIIWKNKPKSLPLSKRKIYSLKPGSLKW